MDWCVLLVVESVVVFVGVGVCGVGGVVCDGGMVLRVVSSVNGIVCVLMIYEVVSCCDWCLNYVCLLLCVMYCYWGCLLVLLCGGVMEFSWNIRFFRSWVDDWDFGVVVCWRFWCCWVWFVLFCIWFCVWNVSRIVGVMWDWNLCCRLYWFGVLLWWWVCDVVWCWVVVWVVWLCMCCDWSVWEIVILLWCVIVEMCFWWLVFCCCVCWWWCWCDLFMNVLCLLFWEMVVWWCGWRWCCWFLVWLVMVW